MIYLDHAATSPLRPSVWRVMEELVGRADYNPASVHTPGGTAAAVLEDARARVAEALDCPRSDLVFTGGGTQSDNLAVLGFARAHGDGARILVSAIEHKAVIEAAGRARREGSAVEMIPVDSSGTLLEDVLEERLAAGDGRPTLLSVMWANNEIGTVQPVHRLCDMAHRHGGLFHTDAVQAVGKVPVSLADVPADLLSVTAHKLGGPVGIGILYRRAGVRLEPLSYGGSQENALWPGTQNPLGAAGFAEAVHLAVAERDVAEPRWTGLRERLEARLAESVPGLRVHGAEATRRLPHVLSVGIPGCDQAVVLTSLDIEGVALTRARTSWMPWAFGRRDRTRYSGSASARRRRPPRSMRRPRPSPGWSAVSGTARRESGRRTPRDR